MEGVRAVTVGLEKRQRVHHRKLREDGVVVERLKTGIYRVAFGSLIVECRAEDLLVLNNLPAERMDRAPRTKTKKSKQKTASHGGAMPSIDLHGMRVEEAVASVERKINEAILADANGLKIIHGLGTGRLKSAVHRCLASISVVKRFKLEDGNAGTTVAYF